MSWSEGLLAAAAILSAVGAIGSVFYKRRQPELDEATAAHQLVSSDAVKTEIERSSRELNAARDLRVLDLEKWADKMRPWVWEVRTTFDRMCVLMREDRVALGLEMPDLKLSEPPEFPPPRPAGA
jgi:hypothetical protein